jgi:signal transduction histidine kinase
VTLQAGGTYYVEALHIQNSGSDSLAVGWEGPGIKRMVIDGQYLTPWLTPANENAGTLLEPIPAHGLLRECWTNFFVSDFAALRPQNLEESFVRIDALKLEKISDEGMPAPMKITAETNAGNIPNLSWIEMDGKVTFAAGSQQRCQLELAQGNSILNAKVINWRDFPIERLINSRVRVRGVLVHGYDSNGLTTGSSVWVPDSRQVSLLPLESYEPENPNQVPICEIQPSNPLMRWGRQVRVRGHIIQRSTNGMVLLQGNDNYQGFYSADGTNWISLGGPVEIGISNSVLVGLAVASASSTNSASATFSNIRGMGTDWNVGDIGNPQHPGGVSVSNGAVIIKGVGDGIGSMRDQQYYAYQEMESGTEISARLADMQSANSHSQVGIMLRESVNRRAPYVAVLFTPIGGTIFQYRRIFGDYSVAAQAGPLHRRIGWMKLVKRKSLLWVRVKPSPEMDTNEEMEVSGIVTWQGDTPVLDEASFLAAGQSISSPQSTIDQTQRGITIADFAAKAEHPPDTYLSRNIRALNLQGVVTFCDVVLDKMFLFVQGGNGGIQVSWPDAKLRPNVKVGQLVEMNGESAVRQFPVMFGPLMFKVTGWGALPVPVPYSSGLSGNDSAQASWVEATGVVRPEETNGLLTLMTSDGPLSVWVGHQGTNSQQYADNAVLMRGVLSFDAKHSARLLVPGPDFIEVLESSPADPFAIPCFTIAQLAGLNVKPEQLRRMKLSGVVTCSLPQGIYVQDETGGAFVHTKQADLFQPGDQIEAVGYLNNDSAGVTLGQAEVHKTGVAAQPAPGDIITVEINGKNHTSELVRVMATLIEQHKTWGGQVLVLQVGAKILEATILVENNKWLENIPVGSRLTITGVCQVWQQITQTDQPVADQSLLSANINIWLRTPQDIVVLERPPWWTLKRITLFSSLLVFGLLGTLIWVRILRRRVASRSRELLATMHQLEKEARASALLAERDRLAGEIHDSLEQGLTAIMMQLDAAEKHVEQSPEARTILHRARNMAEFSRAEIQHAVWDILSPLLDDADLATAIKHVVDQISSGLPEVKIVIKGSSRPLPSSHEHHLLRMVQEAITNAIKHAKARAILVTMDYTSPDFKLVIEDDGMGFIPGAVKAGGQNGHFGIQGMRARAKKLEAQLEVASQVGKGTVITIHMKVDGEGLNSNGIK